MNGMLLTDAECRAIHVGEAVTMATVALVFAIVILTIAAYKLFTSGKAKVQMPGGYKFEWA